MRPLRRPNADKHLSAHGTKPVVSGCPVMPYGVSLLGFVSRWAPLPVAWGPLCLAVVPSHEARQWKHTDPNTPTAKKKEEPYVRLGGNNNEVSRGRSFSWGILRFVSVVPSPSLVVL